MNLVYSFKTTHDIKWAMVFFKDTFFEPAKMIIVSPKFHVEHSDEIIKLGLIPLITPHWPGETYRLASFENLTDAWSMLSVTVAWPCPEEKRSVREGAGHEALGRKVSNQDGTSPWPGKEVHGIR